MGGEKSRSWVDVCLASDRAMRALTSSIVVTGLGDILSALQHMIGPLSTDASGGLNLLAHAV